MTETEQIKQEANELALAIRAAANAHQEASRRFLEPPGWKIHVASPVELGKHMACVFAESLAEHKEPFILPLDTTVFVSVIDGVISVDDEREYRVDHDLHRVPPGGQHFIRTVSKTAQVSLIYLRGDF